GARGVLEVGAASEVVAKDEIAQVDARARAEGEEQVVRVQSAHAREEAGGAVLLPRARRVHEEHAVDPAQREAPRPSEPKLLDEREAELEIAQEHVRAGEIPVARAAEGDRAAVPEQARIPPEAGAADDALREGVVVVDV